MNYAIMPLSDYDAACDKVREKVDLTTVKFEETDFGYIRSAVFTAKESGEYIFTVEVKDESKLNIYEAVFGNVDWNPSTQPGQFDSFDGSTASGRFGQGVETCIYVSNSRGLKPSDIISATLSYNGEVVENFVEPPKIKSGELADKVDKVYWTAASDFGLKGKGQGEFVHFEPVHPIEHKVEVAVSDPTAKVKVNGKNLFNINRELGALTSGNSNASIRKDFDYTKYYLGLSSNNYYYPMFIEATIEDNTITYKGKATPYYGIAFPFKVVPNTVYSFSCIVSADNARLAVAVSFYDKDGAYISNTTNTTFTTPSNCYTAVFVVRAPDTTNTYTASDIQIEYGTTPTEYTEYIEPAEYTANADGTVEGVQSISPVMNLMADKAGAVIDAECFLDPAEIITSIVTLGGEL